MKKFLYFSISITVLLIGASFLYRYVVYIPKLDRQKQEIAKAKEEENKLIQEAKAEQEKKEYIVKRKKDCYDLETSERKKWSNVLGGRYDETDDLCYIRYKATDEWKDTNCDDLTKDLEGMGFEYYLEMSNQKTLCKNGEFENSF